MTVAPDADRDVLSAIFAARLSLARKTEEEAIEEARALRRRAIMWLNSNNQREHSFLWFCDVLGVEAGPIRKTIKESRKEVCCENND